MLDAARQRLGGPVVVVWDNSNTHVSRTTHELIDARSWLTVHELPPYAPERDPVEGLFATTALDLQLP
ncbi:transposase [Streptomyces acidiscabies]|uniref:transposase n=1 Tax=Streptomyces acidiscabies TaxID=42234 RepID=UPI0038F76F20